jgi:hypothetical protein
MRAPKSARAAPACVAPDRQINLFGAPDQTIVGVRLRVARSAFVAALKVSNVFAAEDAKARAA